MSVRQRPGLKSKCIKALNNIPKKNNIYMTMYEVYAQENMKEMNISTNVGLLNIQLASFFF